MLKQLLGAQSLVSSWGWSPGTPWGEGQGQGSCAQPCSILLGPHGWAGAEHRPQQPGESREGQGDPGGWSVLHTLTPRWLRATNQTNRLFLLAISCSSKSRKPALLFLRYRIPQCLCQFKGTGQTQPIYRLCLLCARSPPQLASPLTAGTTVATWRCTSFTCPSPPCTSCKKN